MRRRPDLELSWRTHPVICVLFIVGIVVFTNWVVPDAWSFWQMLAAMIPFGVVWGLAMVGLVALVQRRKRSAAS